MPQCPAGWTLYHPLGDTLYRIAQNGNHGRALLDANPGVDPNSLSGQRSVFLALSVPLDMPRIGLETPCIPLPGSWTF